MSEDTPDQEKSPDEFVAEIMEIEAEEAAAPERTVKRRSRIPIFVALLVVFTALLAWNVVRIAHNPPVFTDSELEDDALFALFVTSQGLEEHLDSVGPLPMSLEVVALDEEGLQYQRLDDSTYVLTFTVGTTDLVYRRGENLARLETAADVLSGETER